MKQRKLILSGQNHKQGGYFYARETSISSAYARKSPEIILQIKQIGGIYENMQEKTS